MVDKITMETYRVVVVATIIITAIWGAFCLLGIIIIPRFEINAMKIFNNILVIISFVIFCALSFAGISKERERFKLVSLITCIVVFLPTIVYCIFFADYTIGIVFLIIIYVNAYLLLKFKYELMQTEPQNVDVEVNSVGGHWLNNSYTPLPRPFTISDHVNDVPIPSTPPPDYNAVMTYLNATSSYSNTNAVPLSNANNFHQGPTMAVQHTCSDKSATRSDNCAVYAPDD
ncbi:uncharacterized protein LOC116349720 [Contarinia nasturtii]|uniref:uncharacterized protein LOC116349720 n=1 Tax=Contarinia nasturtii TaxID=265458 RepID=UPI0012D49B13|nr:uncharacterized protein LOC116349720 [Contarinia nasturtii]